jgi:hypothetical protein
MQNLGLEVLALEVNARNLQPETGKRGAAALTTMRAALESALNGDKCAAVRGDGPQGGGAGSGGGREAVDGAHELEQDRKGGAHSILVSSGQAKQLSRDQLRPLALNPNKSPVGRVVGEIVAAHQCGCTCNGDCRLQQD